VQSPEFKTLLPKKKRKERETCLDFIKSYELCKEKEGHLLDKVSESSIFNMVKKLKEAMSKELKKV
jgi:hypothetical protein